MSTPPLKLDAPFFTEEELDELYERDPVQALKISREQHRLRELLEAAPAADPDAPPPAIGEVRAALEEARRILLRDGGDLEFVALDAQVLKVRLKGNCVGCPRSVIDLKHVVERLVRNRFPQILRVENTF